MGTQRSKSRLKYEREMNANKSKADDKSWSYLHTLDVLLQAPLPCKCCKYSVQRMECCMHHQHSSGNDMPAQHHAMIGHPICAISRLVRDRKKLRRSSRLGAARQGTSVN